MKKDYSVFVSLLMVALFGLLMISAIAGGAKIYKSISVQGNVNFNTVTATGYITTQIRNAQNPDSIYIDQSLGTQTLNIPTTLDNESYVTRIYLCNGYLCELFTYEWAQSHPQDGQQVLPAGQVSFELDDGLLTAEIDGKKLYLEVEK